MGCCCGCFEKCDPCCRRLGCGCKDHDSEGRLASIEKNRSCTDIPCILVFAAFIVFLVSYVWATAFVEGDPDRLIRGVNHAGKICGKTEGVKDLPFAFWPDVTNFRFKVCTDDCAATLNGVGNHISFDGQTASLVGYPSEIYMDKYCVPAVTNVSISGFDDWGQEVQRSMGDVETSLPIIGASIGVAIAMSFFYIWLMKCCVGVLVWSTVGAILVGGLVLGYTVLESANDDNLTDNDKDIRTYGSYVIFGITFIFFVMIIFARNRIRIAIQVIKSAGRAIGDMPLMVFFPIWPLLATVGFFFAWVFGSIYIFSAGESTTNDIPSYMSNGDTFVAEGGAFALSGGTFSVIDYDNTIQNAFAPHFFLLLWVVQIGVYFTFTVIAGAVANWYFTPRGENGKKLRGSGEGELPRTAVCRSCCRTTRYHLGTIIYAALIIAIIQFIRACVRYIERQLNASGKEPNKLQKLLFRILDCALWCLECCLDKVSKNALIWMSIYGDAFCPSVCGSFKLIWSNLVRIAVITFFSGIVTMLGKIMIPLMTTAICGLALLNLDPYKTELGSPLLPLVIIFIISFAVANMFLTVYDTAIDTVFMCFLIDEKQNKGQGMLADPGLRSIVEKYEDESKQLAASVQRKGGQNNAVANNNNDVHEEAQI